jgi:hypothetical protein
MLVPIPPSLDGTTLVTIEPEVVILIEKAEVD